MRASQVTGQGGQVELVHSTPVQLVEQSPVSVQVPFVQETVPFTSPHIAMHSVGQVESLTGIVQVQLGVIASITVNVQSSSNRYFSIVATVFHIMVCSRT